MDLKTFVKQALTEIVEGVLDAQRAVAESGARINPRGIRGGDELKRQGSGRSVQDIEFDVATTATDSETEAGKVRVMVVSVGGGHQSQTSIATRIKFSVPVTLPLHPETPADEEERRRRLGATVVTPERGVERI